MTVTCWVIQNSTVTSQLNLPIGNRLKSKCCCRHTVVFVSHKLLIWTASSWRLIMFHITVVWSFISSKGILSNVGIKLYVSKLSFRASFSSLIPFSKKWLYIECTVSGVQPWWRIGMTRRNILGYRERCFIHFTLTMMADQGFSAGKNPACDTLRNVITKIMTNPCLQIESY